VVSVYFFLLTVFVLVRPADVFAATFDPNGTFIIKTVFYGYPAKNASDNSEWPKVAVYANNGSNFDGSIDYADCTTNTATDTFGATCGTPNLFQNKLLGVIEVKGRQYEQSITVKKSQILGNSKSDNIAVEYTKLSYVFFNDYWNPSANADRDVAIVKVEIIDPQQNNKVVKTIMPNTDLLQPIKTRSSGAPINVYADWGLVNIEGTRNDQQNGMNAAFDKSEREFVPGEVDSLPSFWQNGQEGWIWKLTKEGSLNIVISNLGNTIPQAAAPSCKIDLKHVGCTNDQARFTYTFNPAPNFTPYKNLNFRLNAYPTNSAECRNAQGQPIDWFCGKTEGKGEDRFIATPPSDGETKITITPGVEYSARVSFDQDSNQKQLPTGACTSQTITFRCPIVGSGPTEPTPTPTPTPTATPAPTFLPGDINQDHAVNRTDYDLLMANFNRAATQGDLNGDGYVNIFDFSILVENYLKTN
jgi:hypothetical protein